jgi:hypothetical protein
MVDASSQQLARALLVFVVSDQIEDAVEALELFLYTPDLSKHGLNLEQHARVMAQRQVSLLQGPNELGEIFDSPWPPNKDLGSTGVVANEVGFSVAIESFV